MVMGVGGDNGVAIWIGGSRPPLAGHVSRLSRGDGERDRSRTPALVSTPQIRFPRHATPRYPTSSSACLRSSPRSWLPSQSRRVQPA